MGKHWNHEALIIYYWCRFQCHILSFPLCRNNEVGQRWGSLRILKITPKGVRRGTISPMCTISLNKTRDVLIFVVFIFFGVGRRSVSEFGPGSF